MSLFTDTVTIYNKISDTEWKRTVVEGVQWSDKTEKKNDGGKISIAHYVSVTFPEGTYEDVTLASGREEDCIVYLRYAVGIIDNVSCHRSDGSDASVLVGLQRPYSFIGECV